jgi:hypothetical protein
MTLDVADGSDVHDVLADQDCQDHLDYLDYCGRPKFFGADKLR